MKSTSTNWLIIALFLMGSASSVKAQTEPKSPIGVLPLPVVTEGDSLKIPFVFWGPIPVDSALTAIEFTIKWMPKSGLTFQHTVADFSKSAVFDWNNLVNWVQDDVNNRIVVRLAAPAEQSFASDSLHIRLFALNAIVARDENHEPIELLVDSVKIFGINGGEFIDNRIQKVGVIFDKNGMPPPVVNSHFQIQLGEITSGSYQFPLYVKHSFFADSTIQGFKFTFDWDAKNIIEINDFNKTSFSESWDLQIVEENGKDVISLTTTSSIVLTDTLIALINFAANVVQPDFDISVGFYLENIHVFRNNVFELAQPGRFEIGRAMVKGKTSGGGGETSGPGSYSGFVPLLPTDSGRVNNGLYGGRPLDFAWDSINKHVYITTEAASSVYVSADSGRTWTSPFPIDSLEWFVGNERRGWGGSGIQVVADGGYVYTVTVEQAGTLNSTQVKRPGANFTTLLHQSEAQSIVSATDPAIRAKFDFVDAKANHVIVGSDSYLLRSDDGGYNWSVSLIPSRALYSNYEILSVGLLSDTTTHFVAIVKEKTGSRISHFIKTTDAITYTKITPVDTDTLNVEDFVIHPDNSDTLFVATRNPDSSPNGIWRTFDGGNTWTRVKELIGSSTEYRPLPELYLYKVSGIALLIVNAGGGDIEMSDDLGNSFKKITGKNDPVSNVVTANSFGQLHIPGTQIFFGDGDNAPTRSTDGLEGTYIPVPEGIEGVQVWQIAQSPGVLDTVYLATSSGIAFTTVYTRTDIPNTAKWAPPYGKFPINPNNGGNTGFTAIQVYENDPNHVIGANGNGLFVSFTGGKDNTSWFATDYGSIVGLDLNKVKNDGGVVTDIVFVNADTVYASLKTTRTLYGALLASYDGGKTWSLHSGVATNRSYNALKKASNGTLTYLYLASGGIFGSSSVDSGAVFRSTDHGKTWSFRGFMADAKFNPLGFPMPVNDMEAVPGSLDTLYFAAGSNLSNVVAVSYDGGLTINPLFGGYEGAFDAVAINKHNPDSIYFAVRRNIFVFDATSATTELLYRGFPGELTYDLLYDGLTQGSSGGFFNIKRPVKSVTFIDDWISSKPNEVELFQNYPNPFNPTTTISFKLPAVQQVDLTVYNVLGQKVATLLSSQKLQAGLHQISFDANRLSSGVYFYSLRTGNTQFTKKMLLIK